MDTNIVIEAVRTGSWNAVTGQRQLVTVEECASELLRGDATAAGYIAVSQEHIDRISVEVLSMRAAAEFRLAYPEADGLDAGERDLLAHAATRKGNFFLCSCDKAAVRAAHALGWLDRVVSLQSLVEAVSARPTPPLRRQFTDADLSSWRTSLLLGGRL